jgi:hypothetical protein
LRTHYFEFARGLYHMGKAHRAEKIIAEMYPSITCNQLKHWRDTEGWCVARMISAHVVQFARARAPLTHTERANNLFTGISRPRQRVAACKVLLCPDCILARESVTHKYRVVSLVLHTSPIHNRAGKWSVEMINANPLSTLEDYVVFRSLIAHNIARVVVTPGVEYFIVRTMRARSVHLARVDSLAEVLSAHVNEAIDVFHCEPHLTYSDAEFAPDREENDPAVFNYWRGWKLDNEIHNQRATRIPMASIEPILRFIKCVWAASIAARMSRILHHFAHMIQHPGKISAYHLIFRAFPDELVYPLLKFIARSIVGEYYEPYTEGARLRIDCLFTIVRHCHVTTDPVMLVARNGARLIRARFDKYTRVIFLAQHNSSTIGAATNGSSIRAEIDAWHLFEIKYAPMEHTEDLQCAMRSALTKKNARALFAYFQQYKLSK